MNTPRSTSPSAWLLAMCCTTVIAGLTLRASAQSASADTWVLVDPLPTGQTLNAVATRAAVARTTTPLASLCVAVGANGAAVSSPDGVNGWVARTTGTANTLNAIAYAQWLGTAPSPGVPVPVGYETFVAVGSNGTVATTKDGVSWTLSNVGSADNLTRIVWSGTQFLASSEAASATCYTSPDAVTWTARTMSLTPVTTRDLIWSEPSGTAVNTPSDVFVALLDTGFLTSATGSTWTAVPFHATLTAGSFVPKAMTWNANTKFTVVGTSAGHKAIVTATAITGPWVDITPADTANRLPSRVLSLAAQYSATSDQAILLDQLAVGGMTQGSVGGLWSFKDIAPNTLWMGAAKLPGGSSILVGTGGRIVSTRALIGGDWSWANPSPTAETLNAVAARATIARAVNIPAVCVAVGNNGVAATSPNGTDTWVTRYTGTPENLNAIAYAEWRGLVGFSGSNPPPASHPEYETFIAVGNHGTIATTKDGINWTVLPSAGRTENLIRIVWNGIQFLAASGDAPAVCYTSTDAITWTKRTMGASVLPVRDLTWCEPTGTLTNTANDMYVALLDTEFMTSNDGITWAHLAFSASLTQYIGPIDGLQHNFHPTAITWHPTRKFIVVGTSDSIPERTIVTNASNNISVNVWTDVTPISFTAHDPSRVLSLTPLYGNAGEALLMFNNGNSGNIATGSGSGGYIWDYKTVQVGVTNQEVEWKGAARLPGGVAILVGEGGRILTSSETVPNSFSSRFSTGSVNGISSAVWTNTMVAVTDAGELRRSLDGNTWRAITSTNTSPLHDVIWSGSQFVSVGDAGKILCSNDAGLTWVTGALSLATAEPLVSVVWDGSTFIAVGGSSVSGVGKIYTSTNGVDWTARSSGSGPLSRVIVVASNKLVAMDGGNFITSIDHGASWSISAYPDSLLSIFGGTSPFTDEDKARVKDILWDGSRYVVVGNKIATSNDIIPVSVWVDRTPVGFVGDLTHIVRSGRSNLESPLNTEVLALSSDSAGSMLRTTDDNNAAAYTSEDTGINGLRGALRIGIRTITVGDNGSLKTRDDGVATWIARDAGTSASIQAIAANGYENGNSVSKLYAIGGSTASASPQGSAWSDITPTGLTGTIMSVVWTGANYFAVNNSDNGVIFSSVDGLTWSVVLENVTDQFYRIYYTGSQLIAVGDDDVGNSAIWTSPTGLTGAWTRRSNLGNVRLTAISSSPTTIVVGGLGGKMFSSPTGAVWTAATVTAPGGTTVGDITDIEWNGSMFVAVSANGVICTSVNGTSWTAIPKVGSGFNTVTWTGAQFVAMGNKGTNFVSYNGLVWRDNTINTDANFNEVVWMGSRLVAFGDRGAIMVSDGIEPVQPALSFTSASSSVPESGLTTSVTINLHPASPLPLTFNIAISGTATATADYTKTTTLPITFAANETTKVINFTIKDDLLDEHSQPTRPDETIILNFTGIAGEAKVGLFGTHTITILDNDQLPTFTAHPQHQLVGTGSSTAPFSYTESGGSLPMLLRKWRKNGVAILGQTGATLTFPNVTIKDFGKYDVQLTNSVVGGAKDSNDAYLGVVDAAPKTVVVLAGAASTAFTQVAAGTEIAQFSYVWKKAGSAAPLDANHALTLGKPFIYTIKNATLTDSAVYVCEVSDPHGHTVPGGAISLWVVDSIPVITPIAPVSLKVSESFDFTPSASNHPTKWIVAGLPPGLKADLATGRIYGHPTKDSLGVPSKVKFTAINPKGSSATLPVLPVEMLITVTALPAGIQGTFMAKVNPDLEANNDTGGRIEFAIGATGAYTGKAYLGAGVFPFNGVIDTATSGNIHTSTTTLLRAGKTTLPLTFTLNTAAVGAEITGGSIGAATIPVGWFYPWSVAVPAASYTSTKSYTFGLLLNPLDEIQANPNGAGFGNFKVATTGKLTAAFTMADGVKVSQASFVSSTGRIIIFAPLYKGTGSIRDELTLTAQAVAGHPIWFKKAQAATVVDRTYKIGIGPLTLDVMGGLYTPPVTVPPAIIMGLKLPTAPNLNLDITQGGPATGTPIPVNLHLTPSVAAPALVTMPVLNLNLATLKFTTSTGAFTGTFTLTDPDALRPGKFVIRKATYNGQLYPDGTSQLVGTGYFLLPELPATLLETTLKTKQNSGLVEATKVP